MATRYVRASADLAIARGRLMATRYVRASADLAIAAQAG
jgi:hypothetical protein